MVSGQTKTDIVFDIVYIQQPNINVYGMCIEIQIYVGSKHLLHA